MGVAIIRGVVAECGMGLTDWQAGAQQAAPLPWLARERFTEERATIAKSKATAKSQRDAGATRDCDGAEALLGFLHGFEVGFEGGAVLFLGF